MALPEFNATKQRNERFSGEIQQKDTERVQSNHFSTSATAYQHVLQSNTMQIWIELRLIGQLLQKRMGLAIFELGKGAGRKLHRIFHIIIDLLISKFV